GFPRFIVGDRRADITTAPPQIGGVEKRVNHHRKGRIVALYLEPSKPGSTQNKLATDLLPPAIHHLVGKRSFVPQHSQRCEKMEFVARHPNGVAARHSDTDTGGGGVRR
ncbi:MAG: hypothetical protein UZ07_CHB004001093, partial [Chlorobi bacterium OLB7]